MDKKPLIGVSILAVVLLVLGSLSNVAGYQTEVKENNNSISAGSPDITILTVEEAYDLDWGHYLEMVVKNIGDVPTQDIRFHSDIYYFGIYRGRSEGISSPLDPEETTTFHVTEFGDWEPPPFIGLVRVRCYVETDYEKDYSNNFFAHSYFIVKLGPIWVFKKMPW
jgi:hypothetical protein